LLFSGVIIILFTIIYPLIIQEKKLLKRAKKISSILKDEFKKKTTQLVTVFCSVYGIGFGILIFAIPLYLKTILHLDVGQIGLVVTIYTIILVTGTLLGGVLADK